MRLTWRQGPALTLGSYPASCMQADACARDVIWVWSLYTRNAGCCGRVRWYLTVRVCLCTTCRARLTLNGAPAPLSLLHNVRLTVTTTDMHGAEAKAAAENFTLRELPHAAVHTLKVPEGCRRVAVVLSGTVTCMAPGPNGEPREVKLQQSAARDIATADSTDAVAAAHLSLTPGGGAVIQVCSVMWQCCANLQFASLKQNSPHVPGQSPESGFHGQRFGMHDPHSHTSAYDLQVPPRGNVRSFCFLFVLYVFKLVIRTPRAMHAASYTSSCALQASGLRVPTAPDALHDEITRRVASGACLFRSWGDAGRRSRRPR